ncbi:MAG: hypothetical protein AABY38_03140 [Planctomycetota bacterium]
MEVAPVMTSGPTCTPWTKNAFFGGHFGMQILTSTKDWPTRMTPRAEIVRDWAGILSPFRGYQTFQNSKRISPPSKPTSKRTANIHFYLYSINVSMLYHAISVVKRKQQVELC